MNKIIRKAYFKRFKNKNKKWLMDFSLILLKTI